MKTCPTNTVLLSNLCYLTGRTARWTGPLG